MNTTSDYMLVAGLLWALIGAIVGFCVGFKVGRNIEKEVHDLQREREKRMAKGEITYIEVAGRQIPAVDATCPECGTLDLNTTFQTATIPWTARCSKSHEWKIPEIQ